jgi:hypothetical protein
VSVEEESPIEFVRSECDEQARMLLCIVAGVVAAALIVVKFEGDAIVCFNGCFTIFFTNSVFNLSACDGISSLRCLV